MFLFFDIKCFFKLFYITVLLVNVKELIIHMFCIMTRLKIFRLLNLGSCTKLTGCSNEKLNMITYFFSFAGHIRHFRISNHIHTSSKIEHGKWNQIRTRDSHRKKIELTFVGNVYQYQLDHDTCLVWQAVEGENLWQLKWNSHIYKAPMKKKQRTDS